MGGEVEDVILVRDEDAEVTFAHDDSDIQEEVESQYEENFWRKDDEYPTGYTFKGKKKIFDVSDNISYKSRQNFTYRHFLQRLNIYKEEQFKYEINRINL